MRALYDRQTIVGLGIAVGPAECKQESWMCTIYPFFVSCTQQGAEKVTRAAASEPSSLGNALADKQR